MLAFAAWYEGEMGKLPNDASELTREMRHRELLGLEAESTEPQIESDVDIFAALAHMTS